MARKRKSTTAAEPKATEITSDETLAPESEATLLSSTSDLAKSEVLDRLSRKKRNSIPNPEELLEQIDQAGEETTRSVKQYAESALRLSDDETIELKVIKKIASDDARKSRYLHLFRRRKKEDAIVKPQIDISKAARYFPDLDQGLDDSQVAERREHNLLNSCRTSYTKSIPKIFFENIFTFFNMLLTIIAVALICVGSYTDLFFMAIAIINTAFGILQEVKAKLTMDKLRLVTAPTSTVVRSGQAINIPTETIVLDDIVLLSIGNQIAADAIVQKGMIEVNESLLTGESLPIKKQPGDVVYAGSFVVSGSAVVKVDKIGDANYSSSIQSMAKQYSKPKSELVRSLNLIIRAISVVIIPLGVVLFILNYNNATVGELFDRVKIAIESTAGSLIGMIPAGMYLLTTVALTIGVLRLSKRQTLIRELYSIEMLARVNVLCLDKTGTLTDGTMNVEEVVVLDKDFEVPEVMGSYLSSFEENNQTSIALQQAFPFNSTYRVVDKIPFSSSRKYSAVSFEKIGTFILGAPEFIYKSDNEALNHLIAEKQARGYRALMLAHTNAAIRNEKINGVIEPVAIFILIDHVRPEAPATIKWFNDNGVECKIISGDNPLTASEIAKACGVPNAENWVSLDGLSINEVQEIADKYTVFGRVSPEQKAALVKSLKNQQKVVAMTGDGVNDILAMKNADCSIAMHSGADAAKAVAHLVLLNSNFASMPRVVEEGRRVVNNIQRSSALFLMKTFFTISMSIFVIVSNLFGLKMLYPFSPKNLMIMEVFGIGLPSAALAIQPNKARINGHFLRNIITRALPGTCMLLITVAICMLLGSSKFYEFGGLSPDSIDLSIKSMAVIGMVICSLGMIYRLCCPLNLYRGVLLFGMILGSTLAIFILSPSFIGIDYRLLNKIQWLVITCLALAVAPMSYIFDRLFSTMRDEGQHNLKDA